MFPKALLALPRRKNKRNAHSSSSITHTHTHTHNTPLTDVRNRDAAARDVARRQLAGGGELLQRRELGRNLWQALGLDLLDVGHDQAAARRHRDADVDRRVLHKLVARGREARVDRGVLEHRHGQRLDDKGQERELGAAQRGVALERRAQVNERVHAHVVEEVEHRHGAGLVAALDHRPFGGIFCLVFFSFLKRGCEHKAV